MAERDDGLNKLESFAALLGETRSKLQELGDQIDNTSGELDKAEDDVEDKVGGFNDLVQEFTTSFENEHKDLIASLDKHDETINVAGIKALDEQSDTLESEESDFGEALAGARKEMTSDFEELATQGFDGLDSLLATLSSDVEGIQQEAEAAFQAFGAAVQGFEEQAENAQKETFDVFEAVAQNVTDTFTSKMDETFTTISSHLTESMVSQFDGDFGELASNLEDMFTNVGENVERLATELVENGGQILSDLAQQVVSEFMQAVQEAVREAIEEFIQALIADIAMSIVMMNLGAATTSALAPYIPALAVAKNVVGVINDLLDALNPFD